MPPNVILASGSATRLQMLQNAGVPCHAVVSRIDEAAIKAAMLAEGALPRDLADALAEFKARKVADKFPDALVIGCDQVLDLDGRIFDKPDSPEAARAQLTDLSGKTHKLLSAVVVYEAGKPVWRHVGTVRLQMRPLSDSYIAAYVTRNWPDISGSVGAYQLEKEGARLFLGVQGDYFTVLGLPLLDLLSYLTLKGILPS